MNEKLISDFFEEASPTDEQLQKVVNELCARLKGIHSYRWVLSTFNEDELRFARKYLDRICKKTSSKNARLPHVVNLYAVVRKLDLPVAAVELGYRRDFLTCEQSERLVRQLANFASGDDRSYNLRQAAAEFELVMDERRRLVIWHREEIEIDFEREPILWQYFWKLAFAAGNGASIGVEDFFAGAQRQHLGQWKYRLANKVMFPVSLSDRMQSAAGRHRLNVDRRQIQLFRFASLGGDV